MEITIKQQNKSTSFKTVYDVEMLKIIDLFEKVTHARVKDAFYLKEVLTFVVYEGDMMKALGRNLEHLHRIEQMLQKKVKLVEYNADLIRFVSNLIYPYKVEEIKLDGKVITITDNDQKTKGLIIGAKAQNLRAYESIVKKYFDIEEIKVV